MKQKLLSACIATALSCISAVAAATPLAVNGSIADGARLQSGIRSGTFSADGLPDLYQINSASFSFTFTDDTDGINYGQDRETASSYGAYSLTREGYYINQDNQTVTNRDFSRWGTRAITYDGTGQQEGVSLTLGGVAAGSGATSAHSTTTLYTGNDSLIDQVVRWGPLGYYSCGNRCTAYGQINVDYYWSYPTTTYTYQVQDWNGGFTIAGTITDRSVLQTLQETGLLPFDLTITGDLLLTASQLNLDYTKLEPPPSSGVPEPSTIWLLAGALGALGYNRRRRANRV